MAELTAEEALAAFRSNGEVEEVKRKFPETPLLQIREAAGRYISGILKSYREVEVPNSGTRVFVTLQLGLTNCKSVKKAGKDENKKTIYVPVDVKSGEDVVLVAPTRLARALKEVLPGTEVFIEYNGKITAVEKGRSVTSHKFTVRAKKAEKPF